MLKYNCRHSTNMVSPDSSALMECSTSMAQTAPDVVQTA